MIDSTVQTIVTLVKGGLLRDAAERYVSETKDLKRFEVSILGSKIRNKLNSIEFDSLRNEIIGK